VLSLSSVENECEAKGITLVIHPAIRQAVRGFEETFSLGAACYLRGESDGLFFLPLDEGYARLRFTKRWSAAGHPILRVDGASPEDLPKIQAAVAAGRL
jgi:hypothetical protein